MLAHFRRLLASPLVFLCPFGIAMGVAVAEPIYLRCEFEEEANRMAGQHIIITIREDVTRIASPGARSR